MTEQVGPEPILGEVEQMCRRCLRLSKDFKLPISWAVVLSGSFEKDMYAYFLK